jgi:hypothetical protein
MEKTNTSKLAIDAKAAAPALPRFEGEPRGMDLINYVAQCLRMGCDPSAIRKWLVEMGFSEANADKYIADTQTWMSKNPNAGGTAGPPQFNGHMIVGVVALAIGIGVTAVTYLVASGPGGGKYILAWGAMLFGVVEILRGFGPPKSS